MSVELIAAAIAALAAIAAASINAAVGSFGWRASVRKDMKILHDAVPLSNSIDDDLVLSALRASIFERIEKGLAPSRLRRHALDIVMLLVLFIAALAWNCIVGIPITPPVALFTAFWLFLGYCVGAMLAKLATFWPKTGWNLLYQETVKRKKIEEGYHERKRKYEEDMSRIGWVGNYTAYVGWRREKWGAYELMALNSRRESDDSCHPEYDARKKDPGECSD